MDARGARRVVLALMAAETFREVEAIDKVMDDLAALRSGLVHGMNGPDTRFTREEWTGLMAEETRRGGPGGDSTARWLNGVREASGFRGEPPTPCGGGGGVSW